MLFEFAALAVTSGVFGGPTEVFRVPETSSPLVIEQVIESPQDTMSMLRRTQLPLSRMTGGALLSGLSTLNNLELQSFAAGNPSSLASLLVTPPKAGVVAGWWNALPTESKVVLTSSAPEIVGNLNGVPYAFRDIANRTFLNQTIDRLSAELENGVGRSQATALRNQLNTLNEIESALGSAQARPMRELVSLTVGDEPTAAIALGDLDTADYVSYLIPGMFFGVQAQIGEWVDTAAGLYTEQTSWLRLFSEVGSAEAVKTVAAVAWIGYQTPHLLNVGSLDLANEGRDALTATVQGLQASRGAEQPFVSILAHSYGSTAALMALTQDDLTVDALALVGSPGGPAESVADLNVRGEVFVGEADWDPIPNSAFFGRDPGAASFGAQKMSVAGSFDHILQKELNPATGHNEYFGTGTESLRNLALIGIDQGQLVTRGDPADEARTLALLR
jgi:hypothetical protein